MPIASSAVDSTSAVGRSSGDDGVRGDLRNGRPVVGIEQVRRPRPRHCGIVHGRAGQGEIGEPELPKFGGHSALERPKRIAQARRATALPDSSAPERQHAARAAVEQRVR